MLYLKVIQIKFEETTPNDEKLYVGQFSRAQLEALLKDSGEDAVFSVYFNQEEKGEGVRLSLGVHPTPTSRDDGWEDCPPYCYP